MQTRAAAVARPAPSSAVRARSSPLQAAAAAAAAAALLHPRAAPRGHLAEWRETASTVVRQPRAGAVRLQAHPVWSELAQRLLAAAARHWRAQHPLRALASAATAHLAAAVQRRPLSWAGPGRARTMPRVGVASTARLRIMAAQAGAAGAAFTAAAAAALRQPAVAARAVAVRHTLRACGPSCRRPRAPRRRRGRAAA